MLLAVQVLPNLQTIERGHTEMEVDSMHSAIDSARKNLRVFDPSEWPMVFRMTRRNKQYQVREFQFNDFFYLHDLAKKFGSQRTEKEM